MTITLTYSDDLSRVQISAASLAVSEVRIERSANELLWHTVRGGRALTVVSGAISLDDYDGWVADAENFYRIVDTADDSVEESDSITPSLAGEVWLKSIRYPFLNQIVDVSDYSDVERPSRGVAMPVRGRSTPVGVTDIRGARQWQLFVKTATADAERSLELAAMASDFVFLHVPTGPASNGNTLLPGSMYGLLGTMVKHRIGGVSAHSLFTLPLSEVAPPGPDVVGTTLTWGGVANLFGSWGALISANPTWGDLLATVGTEDDLVVL